jgi:hypothetical protein
MKIHEILTKTINEMSSGATGSGAISATPGIGPMIKRSQVGSLFGGTYQQPKKRKAKKK